MYGTGQLSRQTHKEREKDWEKERQRGGGGVTERMRAAEKEGRRGPTGKQEENCLDPFTTTSLRNVMTN